jgi:nitrile hydratase
MADPSRHRFALGDSVRVSLHDRVGHTRAPRYVRGHLGRVIDIDGSYRLPDAVVAGDRTRYETVYEVAFRAADLFGEGDHEVIVNLFDSYLEHVEQR